MEWHRYCISSVQIEKIQNLIQKAKTKVDTKRTSYGVFDNPAVNPSKDETNYCLYVFSLFTIGQKLD